MDLMALMQPRHDLSQPQPPLHPPVPVKPQIQPPIRVRVRVRVSACEASDSASN